MACLTIMIMMMIMMMRSVEKIWEEEADLRTH